MANIEENAPRRAGISFAKIRQALAALKSMILAPSRRSPPTLEGISDHLARDIGLSPADLEELRHEWPSQTTHHPRG